MKLFKSAKRCPECGNLIVEEFDKNYSHKKTITVIELLNKVANDEELPERIKFNNNEYKLDKCIDSYWCADTKEWLENKIYGHIYNEFVEIIEESEDDEPYMDVAGSMLTKTQYKEYMKDFSKPNKIEKIKDKYCSQISKVELAKKINEIIDKVNGDLDEH